MDLKPATSDLPPLDAALAAAVAGANHADPFGVLGPQKIGDRWAIRAIAPGAERVEAVDAAGAVIADLAPAGAEPLFAGWCAGGATRPGPYRLRAHRGGANWTFEDPYRFGPVLGEHDEYFIAEGSHLRLWDVLGARPRSHEGEAGVVFAVWAPGAQRVSVVGDFNDWDGRRAVMRPRGTTGVWEIFLPGLGEGVRYKYEIKARDGTVLPLKADPMGFGAEHPPANASIVRDITGRDWGDGDWMARRAAAHRIDAPITIYEVHLGSWRRVPEEGNRPLSYHELAEQLPAYATEMGFTHVELLPITEHPFDGSWGYQPVGLYS